MSVRADGETPIRVLIVDDEPDVRLLLRVELTRAGFDIVGEAGDGREALECCRVVSPDAVVLDLLMPGLNGFDSIAPLRDLVPGIAIVAYSAVAGEFVRREMARLAVPLLLKSGNMAPLVEKLRELVRSA